MLAPGAARRTSPAEWAGAIVLVEEGRLEIVTPRGASRTFGAGDLLVLRRLPPHLLRNPGQVPVRLVALRRRGRPPAADDRPTVS